MLICMSVRQKKLAMGMEKYVFEPEKAWNFVVLKLYEACEAVEKNKLTESTIKLLNKDKDASEFAQKAEAKHEFTLLAKSLSTKRRHMETMKRP